MNPDDLNMDDIDLSELEAAEAAAALEHELLNQGGVYPPRDLYN